jgi:hypothetical protein
MIPMLLRGAAWFFGISAALSFWAGGRALNEFAKLDRTVAEMAGIALSVLLAVFAVALKGLADRVETHDDGKPISLGIGETTENDKAN